MLFGTSAGLASGLEFHEALLGVGEDDLRRHAHEEAVTHDTHDMFQVAGKFVRILDDAELRVGDERDCFFL